MSDFVDRDDLNIIVRSAILFILGTFVLLAAAVILGLAWNVFRLVGGL